MPRLASLFVPPRSERGNQRRAVAAGALATALAVALTGATVSAAEPAPAQPAAQPDGQPAAATPAGATPAGATPAGATPAGDQGPTSDADEPEDLRGGHFLIYAGGGLAFLPNALVPDGSTITDTGLAGGASLTLGIGLNRYLVLGLDGGFARGGLGDCSCDLTTVSGGLGLAFHPSQAFAFDPWVRFGAGYRYINAGVVALDGVGDDSFSSSAIDFAKLSIGGDFYPLPAFGFGPYLETDIGVRLDEPTVYANVQLGLRIAFDPMRGGTRVSPGVARAY